MKNLPIRLKLVLIYVNMTIFTLIIFFVSFSTMQTISQDQDYIAVEILQETQHISKLETILQQDQQYFRDSIISITNKTQQEKAILSLSSTQKAFDENLNSYALLLREDDATGKELYNSIKTTYFDNYIPLRDKFITAIKSGNVIDAQKLLGDMQASLTSISETVSKISSHHNILAQAISSKSNDMVDRIVIFYPIITVIYILITFLVGRYLAKQIAFPAAVLAKMAEKIAQGNVDVELEYVSKDEIGMLTEEFRKMVDSIKKQAEVLQLVAQGDYRMSIDIRSHDDVVNKALALMLDNNNQFISEILAAADQVSAGAQQIAQGAQNLAAGSSEQASSIEQFSAATNEVMQKSESNSLTAQKAFSLTQAEGEKMSEGILSMGKVQNAMQAIDASSKDITRVIKVIDDIAFQTNILALNAAVEAARAGQHGKGFAVVADEVRNLAAKSAAAAKETTDLIQGSINKVKEGNEIVEHTSENLILVGGFAQENSALTYQISEASKEQSLAISQLTQGISQVSSVVQANSATAEEAAAAAQQMSAQAVLLTSIVSKFKLRENSSRQQSLQEQIPDYITSDSKSFSMSSTADKY